MENKVEYVITLTGSKLFDMVTYTTAKKLCAEYPGLQLDYTDEKHIMISGTLNDYWYEKFQNEVIG